MKHSELDVDNHDLLAALVFVRFGRNHDAAKEAWTRLLQNPGWDDDSTGEIHRQWITMVERGLFALRFMGFITD